MLFGLFVGLHFLFMQGNARLHIARIVTDYLNALDISVMNWPANSPI